MLDKIAGAIFALLWPKLQQEAVEALPKVIDFAQAQFAEWKPEILAFIHAQFTEWMPKIIEAVAVSFAEYALHLTANSTDRIKDAIPGDVDDQIIDAIKGAVLGRIGL